MNNDKFGIILGLSILMSILLAACVGIGCSAFIDYIKLTKNVCPDTVRNG